MHVPRGSDRSDRAAGALLAAYVLGCTADVLAAALGRRRLRRLTKPALMPLLAAEVLAGRRSPTERDVALVLAALLLSWGGDVALLGQGDRAFLAGLALFLAAHGAYAAALVRPPGTGLLREHPALVLPFAAYAVVLLRAVWAGAAGLRAPVTGYGLALVGVAAIAWDRIGRSEGRPAVQVAAGALLFVGSDSLIALSTFGRLPRGPATDSAVMATYAAAQGLLATGLAGRVRPARPRAAAG